MQEEEHFLQEPTQNESFDDIDLNAEMSSKNETEIPLAEKSKKKKKNYKKK